MSMAMTTSLQLVPSPFKNGHFRQPSRRPFTIVAPLAMTPPSSSFPFQLSDGQVRDFHQLPSGVGMEVIRQQRKMVGIEKPALVFVHGSYHAAWCWAVHWLPFFSMQGHDSFAISLLGQGESGVPKDRKPNTLELHARDVADFIGTTVQKPVVLVGHSFGGLVVQFYLSRLFASPTKESIKDGNGWQESYPNLAGAILACSVPPTGNRDLIKRFMRSKPLASIKMTLSLAARAFAFSRSLCRETFFSTDLDDSALERYQALMSKSSSIPLFDLNELNGSLPVPPPAYGAPPVLVVGAEKDFILDLEALQDTAVAYDTEPIILPGIAHDIMLDTRWEEAALMVLMWIDNMLLEKGNLSYGSFVKSQ